MVAKYQIGDDRRIQIGDLVTWEPEHYGYRDQWKCPHVFVVTHFYGKDEDCLMWSPFECPGAHWKMVRLDDGPW